MLVRLRIQGERALFPRPEFARDRVSYDIPTPRVFRIILERIYQPAGLRWSTSRFHVLSEIRTTEFVWPRGEEPARARLLKNVDYIIDAELEEIGLDERSAARADHYKIFSRFASMAHEDPPFLGHPDFKAAIQVLEPSEPVPASFYQGQEIDLGWLPLDQIGRGSKRDGLFRARMVDGVIEVPSPGDPSLFR